MNDWSTRAMMGVFKDRDDADKAVDDLQRLGYGINDISVIMNEGTRVRAFGAEKGSRGGEGVAVGAAAGGALGAIVAGLTATGSIAAIAATGGAAAPLVVGPLAAALAGLGVGLPAADSWADSSAWGFRKFEQRNTNAISMTAASSSPFAPIPAPKTKSLEVLTKHHAMTY